MKISKYLAPLVWGAIIFCFSNSHEANAQASSQVQISIQASSLFKDTDAGFFDGTSFSASYSRELADYMHGFIGVGALSAINTTDEVNLGLDGFSISLLNLDVGIDLTLVQEGNYLFSIGFGGGIRNRKEVFHTTAIELDSDEPFTTDSYVNTIDYGGQIRMNHNFEISASVFGGLFTRLQIYNEGDSVFDIGLTVGKKF